MNYGKSNISVNKKVHYSFCTFRSEKLGVTFKVFYKVKEHLLHYACCRLNVRAGRNPTNSFLDCGVTIKFSFTCLINCRAHVPVKKWSLFRRGKTVVILLHTLNSSVPVDGEERGSRKRHLNINDNLASLT